MKCPYCSEEMLHGKVQARGGGGMYWLPEDEKIMFAVSDKKVDKHNGVLLVSANAIGSATVLACICKACRKIIDGCREYIIIYSLGRPGAVLEIFPLALRSVPTGNAACLQLSL